MITTFNQLISTAGSQKIFLAEIDPSQNIIEWTQHTGYVYYSSIGFFHVLSVYENGSSLSLASSLSAIAQGEWFYQNGVLYVWASNDDVFSNTIVANYRMYFATDIETAGGDPVIFNDHYYEPRLLAVPAISQKKSDFFWGISIISDGQLSLDNTDGFFDNMYEKLLWDNKPVAVLCGGEALPYSEYQKMFSGILSDKNLTMTMFDIAFVDSKTEWDTNIPLNSFSQTAYPWLDDEDVGKPLPLPWGTVKNAPVTCVTRAKGTATSVHLFKIADTSLHSIYSIDQVRVGGVNVTHLSGSVSAASFKLATSSYSPGDDVTVDFKGYVSGSVLIENPVSVLKYIGVNLLGIPWGSTRWDTATIDSQIVEAANFPIGLFVNERTSANDIAGEIVQSCLGTFYVNNSGQYAISIWSTSNPDSPTEITDVEILENTLKCNTKKDDIYGTVIVGYGKNNLTGGYSSVQKTSDTTQLLYGITRSRFIPTLLSSQNGAILFRDRVLLLSEGATIVMSFSSCLQLALKQVADRIQIIYKRSDESSNISWLDSRLIEIFEIRKNFANNTIEITADDLKGIGAGIGKWTSDTPEFPASIGGGSADPWDKTWSTAKKAYAKSMFGYICDDNGYADPTDPESKNISKWW